MLSVLAAPTVTTWLAATAYVSDAPTLTVFAAPIDSSAAAATATFWAAPTLTSRLPVTPSFSLPLTVSFWLPETEIVYISVAHTVKRWTLADKEKAFNKLVKDYIAGKPRMKYIETGDMAIGPDGKPQPQLFVEDMLHFNAAGYKILAGLVRPHLVK